MPTFSIITPVFAGGDAYLRETYESIASQRLPAGWSIQWIVQEDGKTGTPLERLPDRTWISTSMARRGGAARARTIALDRAEGVLLRALDADDLLPDEHALARDIEVLVANHDLGWTVAPALDLHPDGRINPGPAGPPPGRLAAGLLADGLRVGAKLAVGTTTTMYTELLVALGGWPAIPAFEDIGPLLAAEAVAMGWMQTEPGLIYRKHPRQSTAEPEYHEESERVVREAVVLRRADAIRRLGWKWQPSDPIGGTQRSNRFLTGDGWVHGYG